MTARIKNHVYRQKTATEKKKEKKKMDRPGYSNTVEHLHASYRTKNKTKKSLVQHTHTHKYFQILSSCF